MVDRHTILAILQQGEEGMRTEPEIIRQIYDVERDLEIMEPTPGKVAWEYYVKALRWVMGDEFRLIGHFEVADKKSNADVIQR